MTVHKELSNKELNSLRIGDTVAIAMPGKRYHIDRNDRKDERHVVITNITPSDNIDDEGKVCPPLIEWKAEDQDIEQFGDSTHIFNLASSSFVTVIVARKPYRVDYNHSKNKLYNPAYAQHVNFMNGRARGRKNCMSMHNLARIIVSEIPYITLEYGLQERRLRDLWEKDGRPGFKGYNALNGDIAKTPQPFSFEWINRKKFKRWLLKNISRVARTKREYIADLNEIKKRRDEEYLRDTSGDYFNSHDYEIEKSEDAFEESEMREFDEKYGREPIDPIDDELTKNGIGW